MSNILPRSALAATNFNTNIRIYFQAYDGQLLETTSEDGVHFKRTRDPLPAPKKPKTFTPIAATSYHEGREVRVYYLTTDFIIQELCWSGSGWYAGALNDLNVQTASYSNLAVVHYEEKFRVYYQGSSDNNILELINDGLKWEHGSRIREASPGTQLTAIHTSNDNVLHLIYQDRHFATRYVISRNDWEQDTEIVNARTAPGSSLALINIKASAADFRLYLNEPRQAKYGESANPSGEVHAWGVVKTLINNIPLSHLAAVTWGNVKEIRVYSQTNGDDITEYRWEGGWKAGHHIPTA
ncbi:fucose-specific lectin [Kalaharituber pfeilii]|nr:fucose-specific lectin [Kalaharituber pfeilii]